MMALGRALLEFLPPPAGRLSPLQDGTRHQRGAEQARPAQPGSGRVNLPYDAFATNRRCASSGTSW